MHSSSSSSRSRRCDYDNVKVPTAARHCLCIDDASRDKLSPSADITNTWYTTHNTQHTHTQMPVPWNFVFGIILAYFALNAIRQSGCRSAQRLQITDSAVHHDNIVTARTRNYGVPIRCITRLIDDASLGRFWLPPLIGEFVECPSCVVSQI
jgi:hypothetical protein